MFLEMHDDKAPTLCAVARELDYEYQAEQHVIETHTARPYLTLWILFTDDGAPLRAWRRTEKDFEEFKVPVGIKADPRSLKNPGN